MQGRGWWYLGHGGWFRPGGEGREEICEDRAYGGFGGHAYGGAGKEEEDHEND